MIKRFEILAHAATCHQRREGFVLENILEVLPAAWRISAAILFRF